MKYRQQTKKVRSGKLMEIKQQIIEIRKKSGLTQQQFAEQLLVTRQTISNWENGRSYPDLESLIIISEKFCLTLDELIKGDKKMVSRMDSLMKFGKKAKWIISITALILTLGIVYSIGWIKYDEHQMTALMEKMNWEGTEDGGYFLIDNGNKIYAYRHENTFPNPNFRPYRVAVQNKKFKIITNDLKEFEIYNGKGLSFNINQDFEIVKNKNFVEQNKGQAKKFLKENKEELKNLIELEKEYYGKLNN